MLLRNRLKRERVNLLTWKNKKFWMLLSILGAGIFIIAHTNIKLPEDENLSSGNSSVQEKKPDIDNYGNVQGYEYQFKRETNQNRYRLKDLDYAFWDGIEFSQKQYLQGICFTEEYVFVSAYLDDEDSLGEIMVFARESGEYVATFGLDAESHLGGITFDGSEIWICNSTKQALERISYQALCVLVEQHPEEMIDITNLVEVYPIENHPSSIAYYDGFLWVATHNKWLNSTMVSYQYDAEQDLLLEENICWIPSKVQGVAFGQEGEVYFSCSYGRMNSSYLKKYASVKELAQDIDLYDCSIEMPPCSEGIALYDNKLYVLFESAGEKYYAGTDGLGKSRSPIDQILILDTQMLR